MPDAFISHASEDKEAVARPLADALLRQGYEVWYDKYTLRLGDSLPTAIDRGLAECRYGVVILSPHFFAKEWPRRELDGLVARETHDGRKRILPVWHGVTLEFVTRFSPTLASRLAVPTSRGIEVVTEEVVAVLSQHDPQAGDTHAPRARHATLRNNAEATLAEREAASRQADGSFKYTVRVQGFPEDLRAFTSEAIKRFGVRSIGSQIWDVWGHTSFEYAGAHSPKVLETLALRHHLKVDQCGPAADQK